MEIADTIPASSKRLKKLFNVAEALDFLKELWLYTSISAKCFGVVTVGKMTRFRHFCVNDHGSYDGMFGSIREYLEELLPNATERKEHVYFQVLPLNERPKKGRGTAMNVKVGAWLWSDLDYKVPVNEKGFEGCRELDNNALECYYQDGERWVHVDRPSLSKVLKAVEEKLGFKPTIVVDSGTGYHLYFKLSYEIDASRVQRLEAKLVELLGGDPQSKDLARLLRLPGSVNPRVGRPVRIIHCEPNIQVDPEELEQKLQKLAGEPATIFSSITKASTPTLRELRELRDSDILKIVELLKESYRPGYRQHLLLYLSGWLAKAGISPVSAVRIAKALYESTGDTDPLRTRLSAVVYSYRKAGVDVYRYAQDIETLTGVKPYGLEQEIYEERVKGKTGLQEILEDVLGEERALAILHELSEILGVLSPYKDSITELLDYSKQLYAVADLRKLIIARAEKKDGRLIYKERVAVVTPTRIIVYTNPLGGITKYELMFEGATLRKPLILGPALLDEIAERLRLEGLVYHSRLLLDTLSAVIQASVRRGRAEVRSELEASGFYYMDAGIVAVKYEVQEPNKDRLKQALELLDELAIKWFSHSLDKYSTVVKWGIIAPFSYVIKQRGRWVRWLYLYGDSDTGKTTLGRLVLRMWGLSGDHEKSGASIDTEARLGYVLSTSTFPVLVNEPGGALSKDYIVEMIKNAVDGKTARSKYSGGIYVDYPALAPLIFTSNMFLPRDDALLKRLLVLHFSYREKISGERQEEFKTRVEPRLQLLGEIGKCASWLLTTEEKDLGILDRDPIEVGRVLLNRCYELAGLQTPQWLWLQYQERERMEEHVLEEFAERLKKLVNDLYSRYIERATLVLKETGKTINVSPDRVNISLKVRALVENNMIPGCRAKSSDELVMTPQLLRELGLEGRISLKSLSELLGWEYKPVRLGGQVVKAATATLDKLIELLSD